MKLFLCEKPDQAKDIAKVLGITTFGNGFYQKGDVIITWALGHMLTLSQPGSYSSELAQFGNISALPVLPLDWKMDVIPSKKKQVNVIKKLLIDATELVIATDADREGELIARELLDFFGYKKKISRLWLQALDAESIKKGLSNILPGSAKETLHQAALARSHADWLVGMNLSRAYTIAFGQGFGKEGVLSVGRVQTPTLALVAERDQIIKNFVPYEHYGLSVSFQDESNALFSTNWIIPDALKNNENLCVEKPYVLALEKQLNSNDCPPGIVESAETDRKKTKAPLPFSLSELQKEASKRFGIPATKVLDVAQTLYEKYKVTSYPRTPCRYLPISQKAEVPVVLAAVAKLNPQFSSMISKADPNHDARVWNDNQVNKASHHAIIPTMVSTADLSSMSKLEREIYEMIVKRYVAQFYPDYEYDSTVIIVACINERFRAIGNIPRITGWKEIMADPDQLEEKKAEKAVQLPSLSELDAVAPKQAKLESKKTAPPAHYIEATLLEEMMSLASIRKRLEADPVLRKISKETEGLGAESTRGNIIARLLEVGYLESNRKRQLIATEKAYLLLKAIPEAVADPVTTAKWELSLAAIEAGRVSYEQFIEVQKSYVSKLVEEAKIAAANRPQRAASNNSNTKPKAKIADKCPACGKGQLILREIKKEPEKKYLGCSHYPECKFFQWYREV